ncbi:MAG: hypothetical protein NVS1B4_06660 [Gemmatimonadaceae bacterium]
MDYSVTFARHFSRLVWLLLHEPENTGEQKAALRALVTVSKDGAVRLAPESWRLVVNGTPLPEALTGVQDLTAQMIGHALTDLVIDANANPADLIAAARLLATEPIPGDGGETFAARLASAGAVTVRAVVPGAAAIKRLSGSMRAIDPATPPTPPPPAPTRSADRPAKVPAATSRKPVAPESPSVPGRRAQGPGPAPVTAPGHPSRGSAAANASQNGASALGGGVVADADSGHYLLFAAVQAPTGTAGELLAKLDGTHSVSITTRLLDELVTLAESSAREGRPEAVGVAFSGIIAREEKAEDAELRRAFVMAIRRMSKPTLLRAVATLLTRSREQVDEYVAVLARTGEDGAEALIDQLTSAQSLSDRRIYFDALVKLNAGVPALIHMLGDARWYAARNAADLLGEMAVPEAEGPLAGAAKHNDDRVRRAAVTALAKLGTPRAQAALNEALRDSSPQVRLQAAVGLGMRKGQKTASTLTRALDDESDTEVQLQIVAALGHLGTPDAVQRLIKLAEPEGRLFKKRPVELRVAAVTALAEHRTPAIIAVLQEMLQDKEKAVREAVVRAVMKKDADPMRESEKV